jgi:signal transduction histidine kinase
MDVFMAAPQTSIDVPPPSAGPVGFDPFELSRLRNEVRLFKLLSEINTQLRETRDVDSAIRFVVRSCAEFYGTDDVCVAAGAAPFDRVSILFSTSPRIEFALPLLAEIIRGEKVSLPEDTTFSRIRRRERAWGVLLMRRPGRFSQAERRALARITSAASALIREIDLRRMVDVRERIDRKSMEQIRPIDLAYHILDALRSLTRYDHSSAVLMSDGSDNSLRIIAEQIAWRKGESGRIHQRFTLSEKARRDLEAGHVYCFTREGGRWTELEGLTTPNSELACLLDYNEPAAPAECSEAQVLCAPLRGQHCLLGLLKVSCRHAGALGRYEAGLLAAFLPQATLALQNAQRTETLETQMLAAQRKHAMAELARGVSHDLNNALGSVLPIVQQLRAEADTGSLDMRVCREDLRQIEGSLDVCRRIFHGMLSFARRSAASVGYGDVKQALEGTLAILQEGLRKRGIELRANLASSLPAVACVQSDLEQLLLNLISNARDAMSDGGALSISADPADERHVRLVIEDTGCGIPAAELSRVQEPFFTTKPDGSGLGLSICRSIVCEMRGRMEIDSSVGRGTRVTVLVPLVKVR